MGEMTGRERFVAALSFEDLDRVCHSEWGFWSETIRRWRSEGLPPSVSAPTLEFASEESDLFRHLDIAKFGYILPGQYYRPSFRYETIEETDDFRIERTSRGVLQKVSKRSPTIPQFIDYPVKCRRDYEDIRERLTPHPEARYPPNWDSIAAACRAQGHTPLCTHMDGFFASPREMMGLTPFLTTLYEDPALIHQMLDERADFYITVYEKAIQDMQPDFAFIWEDMCFKNGSLLSPAMFREFLMAPYRKLIGFLNDMGIRHVVVDSDGDVLELIPLWMEVGVTALLPFEVRAGMDVVTIAQAFPTLAILGGIDKHRVAEGRDGIDEELARVLPAMVERGGYIAALDHWVPPQIGYDDFCYYTERIRTWNAAR